MQDPKPLIKQVSIMLVGSTALVLIWWTQSYLLYHSIVEIIGIVIGVSLYIIGTHTYRFSKNNVLLFLSVAFLYIAVLDGLHLFTYKGMNVISGATTNQATQYWIAGRLLQIFSISLSPLFLNRQVRINRLHITFFAITTLVVGMISAGYFPTCYVEEVGLTPFKKAMEYLVIFLAALCFVFQDKLIPNTGRKIPSYIRWALAFFIASELSFTLYTDVYGVFNAFGHLMKLISYMFVARMVIGEGLEKPYEYMFKDIYQRSIRDQLTGLLNRSGFEEMVQTLFTQEKRYPKNFAFIFMDLDNFKSINDRYGHAEGDLALIEFSKLLRSSFRESDLLARVGGDEFAVLIQGGIAEATLCETRLQQAVAYWTQSNPFRTSIGVTTGVVFRPSGSDISIFELLAQADEEVRRFKLLKKGVR
jgi:diguanylate cyclase (GGDEF)-like protein